MKTYNTIVILVVCAMVGICAGIVLWAQPINGDLTRIGAHPERWYGWNAPQQRIPDITNTSRDHAKKHILVVGDSFSAIGHWQAFLTDKYSFSFVHAQNTNIHAFLQRVHSEKPDAVVVESVERFALAMFGPESQFMGNFAKKCQTETVGNMSPEIITRNVVGSNASPIAYPTYTRKIFPTSAKEISQGLFYLKQWLWFKIKPRKQATSILDLTHHHLFSNLRNYQLLVVNSDLLLLPDFAAPLINASHCAMRSIANE
ncbi:MAG: hypothetical protein IT470_08765, partial [Pseudomonadales bacterium]|nr:hypothetical protein [Pseudomonadales bacterium]